MNEENKVPDPSPFEFDGGSNYSNYVELEPEEQQPANNVKAPYKKGTPMRASALKAREDLKNNKFK